MSIDLTTERTDAPDTGTTMPAPYPSTQLLDMINADAAAADERADLARPTFDRMMDEGLFHMLVPPEFGGAGATPRQWFDATVAVAHADPSAGWIVAQGAVQNGWIAAAADPRFAHEYFATPKTIATSGAGRVVAERVDDRYVVRDANWSFVSGSSHADYVGGMVMVFRPDGTFETRTILQAATTATIRPTWDTLGLRASASNDVTFEGEVAVPDSLTYTWPGLTIVRPSRLSDATPTVPMISFSAAAVLLGAARRAIEVTVASAEHKRRPLDTSSLLEQAPFIRGLADMTARVELATVGLRHLLDDLWHRAGDGQAPDIIGRARLRLAAAHAADTATEVVRAATVLVGADSTYRNHPLERLLRDSHMLTHHASISATTREKLGAVLLGSYRGPLG
ncbi:MAG: acyl-CoA dehydrogenase family protein, partial [Ilumatobacteraceae bacterium]